MACRRPEGQKTRGGTRTSWHPVLLKMIQQDSVHSQHCRHRTQVGTGTPAHRCPGASRSPVCTHRRSVLPHEPPRRTPGLGPRRGDERERQIAESYSCPAAQRSQGSRIWRYFQRRTQWCPRAVLRWALWWKQQRRAAGAPSVTGQRIPRGDRAKRASAAMRGHHQPVGVSQVVALQTRERPARPRRDRPREVEKGRYRFVGTRTRCSRTLATIRA